MNQVRINYDMTHVSSVKYVITIINYDMTHVSSVGSLLKGHSSASSILGPPPLSNTISVGYSFLNHGQSWYSDIMTTHHIILYNTRLTHMDPYTSFKQLEVVN